MRGKRFHKSDRNEPGEVVDLVDSPDDMDPEGSSGRVVSKTNHGLSWNVSEVVLNQDKPLTSHIIFKTKWLKYERLNFETIIKIVKAGKTSA